MDILVDYINQKGDHSTKTHKMTRLAFAKHLGLAGQRYAQSPQKLLRSISMFFHYSYYLNKEDFDNNRFSSPPIALSDPTEKGQFSNLAGKAIADFLSKRIDGSLYTVNYEAAMRIKNMPIKGNRPDLIAYSNKSVFAIEAKGHTDGPGKMSVHKKQAQTGGIPVNFSVACISYEMYDKIHCNYHDPYNRDVPYDNETLTRLTKNYYSGFIDFLDEKYFDQRVVTIGGEDFYEVELSNTTFANLYPYKEPYIPFWVLFGGFYRPKLILPKNLLELAENGLNQDVKPFIFESSQQQNIYIDNDRIGLSIRP